MNWGSALNHGLIWSGILIAALFTLFKFYPHSLLENYPKELQALANVPVRGTKNGLRLLMAVLWLLIIGYFLFAVVWTFRNESVEFLTVAVFAFLMLMTWNLFDLIILDWLLFCTIQPSFMVLKGTEGHPQYKNYRFHFMGFLKGTVISFVCALVLGGVGYLVLRFLIWE